MTQPDRVGDHLTPQDLAGFVDGRLSVELRSRIADHLADCPDCRGELQEVHGVVGSLARRRWRVLVPIAAAAALALLAIPTAFRTPDPPDLHRELPAGSPDAPTLLAPSGDIAGVSAFSWSRLAGADRYRLTLFTPDGTVVWESQTADTSIGLPDTVRLAGIRYFWKVDGRVGLDRWVASELAEFRLKPPARSP